MMTRMPGPRIRKKRQCPPGITFNIEGLTVNILCLRFQIFGLLFYQNLRLKNKPRVDAHKIRKREIIMSYKLSPVCNEEEH